MATYTTEQVGQLYNEYHLYCTDFVLNDFSESIFRSSPLSFSEWLTNKEKSENPIPTTPVFNQVIWVRRVYSNDSHSDSKIWHKRHFSHFAPDKNVMCFSDGKSAETSVTSSRIKWKEYSLTDPDSTYYE